MKIGNFIIIKNNINKHYGCIGRILNINEKKYTIRLCSSDIILDLDEKELINFFEEENCIESKMVL